MYHQQGQIRDDKYFIRIKEEMIKVVHDEMRDEGYIPVFDLGPYWYTSMGEKKFHFDLCVYGIYVGKKKAREVDFWQDGKLMRDGRTILS